MSVTRARVYATMIVLMLVSFALAIAELIDPGNVNVWICIICGGIAWVLRIWRPRTDV